MFPDLPYRIFAVDPATTKSGWAMLEVISFHPLQIRIIRRGQIDGQQLLREKKDMVKLFSKQFCVVSALEDEYTNLITEFKPHAVYSEGAFVHIHVSAAIALTLAIHALRRACKKAINQDIGIVPPTISKLAFAGRGGADKDAMLAAYHNADFLIKDDSNTEISEHEVDAVAHGCGGLARDILGTVIQVSAQEKRQARREKEKKKKEREEA